MLPRKNQWLIWLLVILFDCFGVVQGQPSAEVESGAVLSGYNDVRIPGNSGTRLSLSQDLSIDPSIFIRLRLNYLLNQRHWFSILVAPLRLEAKGASGQDIQFTDRLFPAGTSLRSTYRFDSYRFTYRYDFVRMTTWNIGAGVTAKIRDASISLEGGGQRAEKRNTGFVPLISFRAGWHFSPSWEVTAAGDALAAPQGRAEDVMLSIQHSLRDWLCLYVGYRILEGGADNDEVYNFALLNYAAAGITIRPRKLHN